MVLFVLQRGVGYSLLVNMFRFKLPLNIFIKIHGIEIEPQFRRSKADIFGNKRTASIKNAERMVDLSRSRSYAECTI